MPSKHHRHLRGHRISLAIVSALALSGAAIAQESGSSPATSQQAGQHSFDIAAQPLAEALQAFARISRQQVTFDAAALAGKIANPVSGRYSPSEALQRLVEGIDVEIRRGTHGVWIVRPLPPASIPAAGVAEMETIVVTGTHIRNVAPTGSPIIVIDSEDIRRSGYSGTEQLLQALPQNFRGGEAGASADVNMSLGSQRGFNMTAGSGVNLRGLGANATLVLINGRRISASSGGTFTDISMIPLDAIERIEVLADGASAVYGADAVGGVVNIILKSDYDSAETRLSFGATTEAGRDEYRVSHSMGRQWDDGSMMLTADYLHQSQLMASERSFTADVPAPTSLFPSNRMASAVFNASHGLTDALTLKGDLQYSRAERFLVTTSGNIRNESNVTPVRRNAALTLDYKLASDWNVALDLFASGEVARSQVHSYLPDGTPGYDYRHVRKQEQQGIELKGSGRLFDTPGGSMRLAVGVSYKKEDYQRTIDLWSIDHRANRDNTSAFAELHVPLIGKDNASAGLHRLDLSFAMRHDDYSDFGSTSNPRVGLSWAPTERLTLRTSYSTSFRAPAIGEEARFSNDGLLAAQLQPFLAADGTEWVPVVVWLGSEELRPELSRNRSIGIDWKPAFADGLSLALTYYDIRYTDRIMLPPFEMDILGDPELQAFVHHYDDPAQLRTEVEEAAARGIPFLDYTFGEFGDDPLEVATTAYRYMWTNARRVDMSGLDMEIRYPIRRNGHHIEAGLDASLIQKIENRLSPASTPFDMVGTFGNPPKLRARGSLAWSYQGISTAMNINYNHSYTDTSGLADRPIRAYTTVDLVTRYMFASGGNPFSDGLSVSLNVTNLLDEKPPYIEAGGLGSHYDSANASPLGRMVLLQLAKRW
ncbi:TonB-dependent receptor [Marilutibacter alkalisoli]|uniref:TonB-dependent receptor n=1 Tax=Marilutibacter alkalisoli TaxID=2591633 RepID=A0A514BVU3_9GAMM|nr:TonB-dependent receptor [Lysobacter alkalisoli]QDH71504.1 TonB-dependent receptor [Lysobacter alkalisoli]